MTRGRVEGSVTRFVVYSISDLWAIGMEEMLVPMEEVVLGLSYVEIERRGLRGRLCCRGGCEVGDDGRMLVMRRRPEDGGGDGEVVVHLG